LGQARVRVREFAGAWFEIEGSARMRLGVANTHLGLNAMLGRRAYDRSGNFEIEIGPVSWSLYQRFLPDADLRALVHEVAELFVRDPLDYQITLCLAPLEVPRLKLSGVRRLGRDTWLGIRERETPITLSHSSLGEGFPSPKPMEVIRHEDA